MKKPNIRQAHIKSLLTVSVLALMISGCSTIKDLVKHKHKENEPAKLIQIASPIRVLSPVYSANIDKAGYLQSKKNNDPLDLQMAADGKWIVAAARKGTVFGLTEGSTAWAMDVHDRIVGGVALDDAGSTAVVTTYSGRVIALEKATGKPKWQIKLGSTILTPALITGNHVLLSANDGVLYGLDLASGKTIWRFGTRVPNVSIRGTAKPILIDAQTALFAAADGRIYAINPDSGKLLWSRLVGIASGTSEIDRMNDVDGTPSIVDQYLYVISYSGQLAGFDMSTGQTMFVSDSASLKSLAVLDNLIIATNLDGKVTAFNRMTGEQVWQNTELANRSLTNAATIGRYVAIGDLDGVVHVFDAKGKIVDRVNTKGKLTSLQVKGNRLYTQSATGHLAIWQFSQ